MKIGIDALYLGFAHAPAGIYQYTLRLLESLQELDRNNEYTVYFFNWRNPERERTIRRYSLNANFKKHICRIPYRALSPLSKVFPLSETLGKVDLLHGPAFQLLPAGFYKKSVVTIHDLKFIKHPEWHDELHFFGKPTQDAVRRADRIVAISEFTRRELIEHFHLSSDRIQVIYPGIGKEFTPLQRPEQIKIVTSRYGIKDRYILFVGLMEAKKNLLRLIEAFSQMRTSVREPLQLVLAGPGGPVTDSILQAIACRSLEDAVVVPGAIPSADLPLLYAGASVFAFPSLHEGFGIPPLEAMASGVPVIASKAAALPEIVGTAGLLVDPMKIEAIAEALYAALTDERLRENLKQRGLERAQNFSWNTMAREMLTLYETL